MQTAHALVEGVLRLVGADDGPAGPIVDHLLAGVLRTGRRLKLDDALLREAEVHPLGVLHVEGALVQLRHRVVGVQHRRLLVHLADDLWKEEEEEKKSGIRIKE